MSIYNFYPRFLVDKKNLSVCSSMTLILPQTKFESVLPKDIGGDMFLFEADASCQILGFGHSNLPLVVVINLILKFLESQ